MRIKLHFWVASAALVFILAGCTTPTHQTERWEYKVVEEFNYSGQLEPRLNQMAREGWQVVSSSTILLQGTSNPVTQIILRKAVAQ